MASILIVDAEPVVRSVVARILSSGGHAVEAVDTVQRAMAILRSHPPDLLLTNVYLPGITGREAIRLFKQVLPALKILIVSGLPAEDAIQQCTGKDGFDIFPKPFRSGELLEKVNSILDARLPAS